MLDLVNDAIKYGLAYAQFQVGLYKTAAKDLQEYRFDIRFSGLSQTSHRSHLRKGCKPMIPFLLSVRFAQVAQAKGRVFGCFF